MLKDGDIINVDMPTIYNSYFSDASNMFFIGNVSPEMHRLGDVGTTISPSSLLCTLVDIGKVGGIQRNDILIENNHNKATF